MTGVTNNEDKDLQEIESENQIDDKEYEEEEQGDINYEENESYHRYEPPKPKTKEELITICEQKIAGCNERIESTHKAILKHKRLAKYHESNISIYANHIKMLEKELIDIEKFYGK